MDVERLAVALDVVLYKHGWELSMDRLEDLAEEILNVMAPEPIDAVARLAALGF